MILRPRTLARLERILAWALVVAFLPSVSYLGHWDLSVHIPGTQWSVGLPLHEGAPGDGHSHAAGDESDHERHCHSGAATCGDTPITGISAFADLARAAAFATAAGTLTLLAAAWWRPAYAANVAPDLQPPRIAFATA